MRHVWSEGLVPRAEKPHTRRQGRVDLNTARAILAGKPVRFRLYPATDKRTRGRSLYVNVQVWPSLKSLRDYLHAAYAKGQKGRPFKDALGMCSSFRVVTVPPRGKAIRTRPIFAEVNLCAANLTQRIVTHEFMHATFAWARRVGIKIAESLTEFDGPDVMDSEEELCYAHGAMCSDFVRRATKLGLYNERGESTPWIAWDRNSPNRPEQMRVA